MTPGPTRAAPMWKHHQHDSNGLMAVSYTAGEGVDYGNWANLLRASSGHEGYNHEERFPYASASPHLPQGFDFHENGEPSTHQWGEYVPCSASQAALARAAAEARKSRPNIYGWVTCISCDRTLRSIPALEQHLASKHEGFNSSQRKYLEAKMQMESHALAMQRGRHELQLRDFLSDERSNVRPYVRSPAVQSLQGMHHRDLAASSRGEARLEGLHIGTNKHFAPDGQLVVNPNPASSADLIRRRGKERLLPKKKKVSALKKVILRERAERASLGLIASSGSEAPAEREREDALGKERVQKEEELVESMLALLELSEPEDSPDPSGMYRMKYMGSQEPCETSPPAVDVPGDNQAAASTGQPSAGGRDTDVRQALQQLMRAQQALVEAVEGGLGQRCDASSSGSAGPSKGFHGSVATSDASSSSEAEHSPASGPDRDRKQPDLDANKSSTASARSLDSQHAMSSPRAAPEKTKPTTYIGPNVNIRYCKQVITTELNRVTVELLQELLRFQDRAKAKDPIKAKKKRRLVVGLREVSRAVRSKRAKCIVVAPNIEEITSQGGLDYTLHGILQHAEANDVMVVFALTKSRIAQVFGRRVRMSMVAICDFDGANELYKQVVRHALAGREQWAATHSQREATSAAPASSTAAFDPPVLQPST